MKWTPEAIEELMRLLDEGLTSYQMAAHFGVTRSAVCGRIYRERVKRGIVIEKPRTNRIRTPYKRKAMNTVAVIPEIDPGVIPPLVLVPDESRLASIVDVTGCRWPVKDDDALVGGVAFCNHDQKDGSSYCPYHNHVKTASYSRTLIRQTIRSAIHLYTKAAA